MTLGERLAAADRFQRSRGFKIAASVAVLVLMVIGASAALFAAPESAETVAAATFEDAEGLTEEQLAQFRELAQSGERAVGLIAELRERSGGVTGLVVGVVVGGAVIALSAWLGLLLTYAAIAAAVALIAGPLLLVDGGEDWAVFLVGVAILAAAFTTIFRGIVLALSLPGPIFAIARNVLSEAVRLRLSVVFIVIMLIGLAALPNVLDPESPLRYRVQSFLQYGSGGAFWIIALLTVTFGVATVAFEQRDRVIWQTMTKPVAAWEYVLGKWLGVSALGAALLAVNAAGVFLFTEYLRQQPALGEKSAFVAAGESDRLSEDRLILETQVLSARASIPNVYEDLPLEEIALEARRRAEEAARRDASLTTETAIVRRAAELQAEIAEQLEIALRVALRRVNAGEGKMFTFPGVGDQADPDGPVVLRFRIDSGTNAPDVTYRMSFSIAGSPYLVKPVALATTHTLPVAPLISTPNRIITIDDPAFEPLAEAIRDGQALGQYLTIEDLVDDDGTLQILMINGDINARQPNPNWLTVPNDGMEVSVSVGSYRANFVRVVGVLWLKLAFLAMLSVTAATFLSFPVALLIAGGAFLVAEASPFLGTALDSFSTAERDGTLKPFHIVAGFITRGVHWVFSVYGDLRPTQRLVTGEMLSWGNVGRALGVLGLWTAVLGGLAVGIFSRRELATYSGR